MTEAGAVALLCGIGKQAAQDVCSKSGVSTAQRLEAYETLRHIGLDRRYRLALLQRARAAQEEGHRTWPASKSVRVS